MQNQLPECLPLPSLPFHWSPGSTPAVRCSLHSNECAKGQPSPRAESQGHRAACGPGSCPGSHPRPAPLGSPEASSCGCAPALCRPPASLQRDPALPLATALTTRWVYTLGVCVCVCVCVQPALPLHRSLQLPPPQPLLPTSSGHHLALGPGGTAVDPSLPGSS